MILPLLAAIACKGRTMDNVKPSGETIEVVVMQDSQEENTQSINLE